MSNFFFSPREKGLNTGFAGHSEKVRGVYLWMTKLTKRINRETIETYQHYNRTIVVSLFADTVSLRLKGTRKSYDIPASHLMDILCRREALRLQAEKRKVKSKPIVPQSRINPRKVWPVNNLKKLFSF